MIRYLHIGFQKTGTTWLQRMLLRNRDRLAGRVALAVKGPETRDLMRACLAWIETPETGVAAVRREAAALAGRLNRTAPVALISDENFVGRNIFSETGDMTTWAAALVPEIATALGPRTEVICYTRDWAGWTASVHNQSVKIRGETRDLDAFRAAIPFAADWDAITARLAREIAPIPLHRIDMEADLASPSGLGEGLLSRLGLGDILPELDRPQGRFNQSLGPGALEFLLAANRSGLNPATLAKVRRLVLDNRELFVSFKDRPRN
ncbi:MAG: hypothetical protein AAFR17_10090 [Pseudomonadota bacterium]